MRHAGVSCGLSFSVFAAHNTPGTFSPLPMSGPPRACKTWPCHLPRHFVSSQRLPRKKHVLRNIRTCGTSVRLRILGRSLACGQPSGSSTRWVPARFRRWVERRARFTVVILPKRGVAMSLARDREREEFGLLLLLLRCCCVVVLLFFTLTAVPISLSSTFSCPTDLGRRCSLSLLARVNRPVLTMHLSLDAAGKESGILSTAPKSARCLRWPVPHPAADCFSWNLSLAVFQELQGGVVEAGRQSGPGVRA